jgi:transposase, IS5 family
MRGQPVFFDIDDRLKRVSDLGDQLEAFRVAVDFETDREKFMRTPFPGWSPRS